MTQHRDIDHVLDQWLAEGPTQVPDRVFDDAIVRLNRQSQVSWRLRWRNLDMTTPMRLSAAAIAIVVLVGVGLFVLRASSTIGPPASPTATLAPSPSRASVVDGAAPLPFNGPIEPGRYFIEKGSRSAATFSFDMPAGWFAQDGGLVKHQDDSAREITWGSTIVETLFADPCGTNEARPMGPKADDLIGELTAVLAYDVSTPAYVPIGDLPGRGVELTVPPATDVATCDPPIGLQVWQDRVGSYLVISSGVPARVITVDVADGRFVIALSRRETTPPADIAEFEAILASIEIEP